MDFLSISLFYILERFAFRIYYFLYHWYVRGFRKASNWTINYLAKLDYKLAFRVNLKNIFQPLYQDYSLMSYILGFLLRSFRIILALIIYSFAIVFASGLFLAWASLPIYAVYQIVNTFFK